MTVDLVCIAGTDLDLMRDLHSSPFAQVWAKFRIACSIGCSRQILRHGHYLEINEHSTRYSEMPDEFVMPPLKSQVGKAMDYTFSPMDGTARSVAEGSVAHAYEQAYQSYHDLLRFGVAREDARSVLPLGLKTRLIVSCHLKGWLRFLSQRTDPHAQDEIREIAFAIEEHLARALPVSLAAWASAGRRAL